MRRFFVRPLSTEMGYKLVSRIQHINPTKSLMCIV